MSYMQIGSLCSYYRAAGRKLVLRSVMLVGIRKRNSLNPVSTHRDLSLPRHICNPAPADFSQLERGPSRLPLRIRSLVAPPASALHTPQPPACPFLQTNSPSRIFMDIGVGSTLETQAMEIWLRNHPLALVADQIPETTHGQTLCGCGKHSPRPSPVR